MWTLEQFSYDLKISLEKMKQASEKFPTIRHQNHQL